MRIVIAESGPPRLEDACDFQHFSILMDEAFRNMPGAALRGIGRLSCDGHAWVRPDCLRALLPVDLPADWETGFARMSEFARSRGWIGEGGAIRAHIEFRDHPEPVSNAAFRDAMRKFASGVCVVAAGTGEERRGMTVSAFSSVSAEPPMILVCINKASASHDAIVNAERFSVNILGAEQDGIARTFAGMNGLTGAQRFTHGAWQETAAVPTLADALQSLVCRPAIRERAGSHTVLIGQVISASQALEDRMPLINYCGTLRGLCGGLEKAA